MIHPKAEANNTVKNEEQNTSKESSQSINSAEPTIKNTNALKEKATLASDYEASSPEGCNVTEEPESNNLEEKSI